LPDTGWGGRKKKKKEKNKKKKARDHDVGAGFLVYSAGNHDQSCFFTHEPAIVSNHRAEWIESREPFLTSAAF